MLKKCLVLFITSIIVCEGAMSFYGDDLNKLEYQKYGKVFVSEPLAKRLNRLETDSFGMSQNGDIEERINKLLTLSSNSKYAAFSYPDNYQLPQKKKFKRMLRNTTEFLGSGYMTGFTPSFSNGYNYAENMYRNEYNDFIRSHSNYCPYNNSYGLNSDTLNGYNPYIPQFNSYHRQTYNVPDNISSGAGVHIIND